MSEYQYYEFQAIDRPLTDKEIAELRSFSTRANITSRSFTNEYSWGDFKGDEDLWMEKYFDGFLYYANWGTHIFKLKLSSSLVHLKTAQMYCNGNNASVRLKNGNIILDFISDNGNDEWEDKLHLSPLLSLRSDLSRGDLRCLYLAWLFNLQNDSYDDDELEPPVPPGLTQLNPALIAFAEFLGINFDLINAASKISPTLEQCAPNSNDFRMWLATLSTNEKENLLIDILEGSMKGDRTPTTKLIHRFNKTWESQHFSKTGKKDKQRTVAELLRETECVT